MAQHLVTSLAPGLVVSPGSWKSQPTICRSFLSSYASDPGCASGACCDHACAALWVPAASVTCELCVHVYACVCCVSGQATLPVLCVPVSCPCVCSTQALISLSLDLAFQPGYLWQKAGSQPLDPGACLTLCPSPRPRSVQGRWLTCSSQWSVGLMAAFSPLAPQALVSVPVIHGVVTGSHGWVRGMWTYPSCSHWARGMGAHRKEAEKP